MEEVFRKNRENKFYRFFDKSIHQWFDFPKDYYETYDRERTAYQKRMQNHGLCCCTRSKWWLCDMFCEDCEYRRAGDQLSLDAPEGDGYVSMFDQQETPGLQMEDVIADRDLLTRLIKLLRDLDPEADTILALWQEDHTLSDRAIAKALGRPQRTFADQMKRYRTDLRIIRSY